MEYLPTPEEQDWLLESLATLIARHGAESFVSRPILEPTAHFFPDHWSFSLEGVDRLTHRLAQYAELDDLEVSITPYIQEDAEDHTENEDRHTGFAGLFLGIEEKSMIFGFNELAPADGEYAAAVMAHEIAHAFRRWHELEDLDADVEEECRTDVTAAYLGFGILVTNSSYRYRTEGGLGYQQWTTTATGYLPPQAFAYLLGVQFVLRDLAPELQERLIRHLEPNQATFTRQAIRDLRSQRADLVQRLALPECSAWPPQKSAVDFLEPLPEFVPPESDSAQSEVAGVRMNEDWPVFRRHVSRATFRAFWATLPVFFLALSIGVTTESLWPFLMVPAAAAAGALWGNRIQYDVCSEPNCRSRLPDDASECAFCGGMIVGRIRSEDDRCEAQDAFFEELQQKR